MSTPTASLDPHRVVRGDDFGWKPETVPFATIPELFAQRGEPAFRALERAFIEQRDSGGDLLRLGGDVGGDAREDAALDGF